MTNLTCAQKDMHEHFSNVAILYNSLRTTDIEPVMFIKDRLDGNGNNTAADIGCGAGRYSFQFLKHLNLNHLTCIDVNKPMLEQASSILSTGGFENFNTIESTAEHTPLSDNSIDYVFSFNAIQHFNFTAFMKEALRITADGGSIIIYTRLRSQNAENIWGKYFPLFMEKETRLYEIGELKRMIAQIPKLKIQCIEKFRYLRNSSLNHLVNLAENSHYSTFSLYEKDEFASALKRFQRNINRHFSDLKHVDWFDEYTMFVINRN